MIDDSRRTPRSGPGQPVNAGAPATAQGLRFGTALMLTIFCAAIAIGGSYGVVRASLSLPARGALSIVTFLAVIGLAYSAYQLIFALVATTGERRWFAREVSERRGGDRAGKR